MVNLLPRFLDVTSGAILIDAYALGTVPLASLRAQIGIVTQRTVAVDDTKCEQHRVRVAEGDRRP